MDSRNSGKAGTRLLLAMAILLIGGATAILTLDELRWRVQVVLLKASGEVEEISWGELVRWLMPESPVYLDRLLLNPNPSASLRNSRYTTPADIDRGASLYRERCSSCHGVDGEGDHGPALLDSINVQSDWDMYRLIQRGKPGTAMPPHDLADPAIWQIMAYVATLSDRDGPSVSQLIPVSAVPFDRIRARESEASNWLTYSGSYDGSRFSELSQITADNIGSLSLKWAYQADTTYDKFEANPIVVDGVMFVTQPPATVIALDAASGAPLWRYDRPIPRGVVLCCGVVNRGVAILDRTVFVATVDAHLIALDAASGRPVWETEVADHLEGYSITAAPLAVDGLVVTGVAGGEAGVRGFLDAYDALSGARVWRFNTIPEPGAPGSESWKDEGWRIGGAVTWMTGSYDPASGLLFWGTGHSIHDPEHDGADGGEDELYGSSIIALSAKSGEMVWHFQATPNDLHGFDANQVPMLVDAEMEGETRALLVTANRNGYYYVLDRATGRFMSGIPFAKQTWSHGLDERGRPLIAKESRPSPSGTMAWPGSVGATNWWPPAHDPVRETVCFPVVDYPSVFYTQDAAHTPGEMYVRVVGRRVPNYASTTSIRCVNAGDGSLVWEAALSASTQGSPSTGGLLATAGDLLFGSDHGNLYAIKLSTGETLWRLNTGADIHAAPVTYGVGDQQFLAIASGRTLMVFGLPDNDGG